MQDPQPGEPVMNQTVARQFRIRRGVLLVPLSLLVGFWIFSIWIDSTMMGGQFRDSPDGRYRIGIDRKLNPSPTDPFWVTLEEIGSQKDIYRIAIHPVDGFPSQGPRGQEEMIKWDPGGQFADLTLDGRLLYRMYIP